MSDIITIIKKLKNLNHLVPASSNDIENAEKELNLTFADEYKKYLKKYGAISAKGIELTGIAKSKSKNVVMVTKQEWNMNDNIPHDMYVVENLGIEGIIILQNSSGKIYEARPNKKPIETNSSLADYIYSIAENTSRFNEGTKEDKYMPSGLSYKPLSGKAFTEAAISNYQDRQKKLKEQNELEQINKKRRMNESSRIYESMIQRENLATKRESFIESVKTNLLCEAIYKIFSEAVRDELKDDPASRTIMRCMTNSFVQENDTNAIIRKMRNGSNLLSEIHNLITSHTKAILENADSQGDLVITQDMKDDFFNALDYTDAESVSEKIKERVATAVADFVDNNAKEHEEIQNILASAADKIEHLPTTGNEERDQAVAESYNQIAKGNVNKIRNSRKNVFHSLVTAMAEQVIRNKDMQTEFMNEGKLDMNKIVNRVELMYTFMETVNSIRLIKVDENFISETIEELKK